MRTGTVRYDSRKGIGEAVFYGVVFSPGGKRAWASGGGQNVVHVYDVGKTLKETGQIPTPYFPAGLAYGQTPRGDRIYVANNLSGVAGATNPPGRTVTVIDPKTNHVDQDDRPRRRAAALRRHVRPQRAQGVRDELDGPLGVGDRHAHRARAAPDPALAGQPPAARRPPERDRRQPAPQRGLHRQRQLRHGLGHRHASTSAWSARWRSGSRRGVRTGAMPNGLAVAPGRQAALRRARRARTRSRCSTSSTASAIGFIPTAWNPTDVDITRNGKRLAITSANAAGRFPRRCAGPYAVGDCSTGDYAYASAAAAAEHQGRHQRRDDAAQAQDAAQAHAPGAAQQPRAGADRGEAEGARRDPPRHLRDQGEPHLRPGARQPRQGRRRPGADAVRRGLRAQPPRARAALHAVRQLLLRRPGLGRRHQLDDRPRG